MIESNLTFIVAAYTVTWTVIAGYLLRLELNCRRARASLAQALAAADKERRT